MSETIGEIADRIPAGEWVDLPEYGIRVKKCGEAFSIARTYPDQDEDEDADGRAKP